VGNLAPEDIRCGRRCHDIWVSPYGDLISSRPFLTANRANLNSSYFTNRQDRYLRFGSHTDLAQYCRDFLHKSSTFSYQLLPSSSQSSAPYNLHWPDPHTHPHHLESKAKQALAELQSTWIEKSRARPPPSESEVLLFPVIQAGQFGIREEEQAVGLIFDRLKKHQAGDGSTSPTVDLTSGYFGLSKLYQSFVLQSGVHTQLLCASPQVRRLTLVTFCTTDCRVR